MMFFFYILGVWCFFFGAVINLMEASVFRGDWYAILLLIFSVVLLIGTLFIIYRQPKAFREPSFTVPLVPWLPGISILCNIYLMFQLDINTWIRFAVWIAVGLAIYFGYGIWHSKERTVN